MKRAFIQLVVIHLMLLPVIGLAQLPLQLPGQQQAEEQEPQWQPPEVVQLTPDWWEAFDTISPDIARQRFKLFRASISDKVDGLDAADRQAADSAMQNLDNLFELLMVERTAAPMSGPDPILTKSTYSMDELLGLQAQLREVQKERAGVSLQLTQVQRQQKLLDQKRQAQLRQYQDSEPESPQRIIAGIHRVAARVEAELASVRIQNFNSALSAVATQTQKVRQQADYALENLAPGEASLDALNTELEEAQQRIRDTSQNVAAVQRQLLEALSAVPVKPSLEILRKQQLTRASAEAALAEMQALLVAYRLNWYRVRKGAQPLPVETGEADYGRQDLVEETLRQVDVWSAQSESTLVSRPPDDSLNTVKNFELAQTVARETLELIDRIRDKSDDLRLVYGVLEAELVDASGGLGMAGTRIRLALASAWSGIRNALDYQLFSIGEVPLTPGGIFNALLIILAAYFISRAIRHGLKHASGRLRSGDSPAIYTLSRLLHYIILLVGVFVALSSVGMDFTNFALIAGALSVGIGFGLQAIVNNFVSGLILLFEGSLRIGDFIELDSGLAGVVREINTRATVVNSNDGVDVVVPNSELVTTKLTNWTLRENVGRLRIPFGVAYGTDKEKVREAALKAAAEMEFILLHDRGREPQVRLVNFGDSALEFELLAWVSRPGIRRPHRARASFLWALDTHLAEAGIEIPFPQRDIHIKDAKRDVIVDSVHPAGDEGPET